ncbi:hypothetical protein SHVI106290_02655 [Shewanella violacea]
MESLMMNNKPPRFPVKYQVYLQVSLMKYGGLNHDVP